MHVKPDKTDVSVYFLLQDAVTGGAYTTTGGETSFNLIYTRDGAAQVSGNVTAALAAADSAHEDNKIFHCGGGLWRCDFPDAAFAAGADHVALTVTHDSAAIVPAVRHVDLAAGDAVAQTDIDSTGTPTTLAKAIECILAVVCGNSSFTESTGVTSFKGQDGTTEIVTNTVDDVGDRSGCSIG
ncbi:MAG: hypothetical protein WBF17_03620 [Phycisphaerae bacterium]